MLCVVVGVTPVACRWLCSEEIAFYDGAEHEKGVVWSVFESLMRHIRRAVCQRFMFMWTTTIHQIGCVCASQLLATEVIHHVAQIVQGKIARGQKLLNRERGPCIRGKPVSRRGRRSRD